MLRTLLIILSLDSFRTLFESFYFGARYSSQSGLIPIFIYDILTRPEIVFFPKVLNLIVSFIIIVILIKKWIPAESHRLEKFQKDHDRLSRILVDSKIGIWEKNLETGSFYYNTICYEMLSYSEGDITPDLKSITKIVHEDDRQKFLDQIEIILNSSNRNISFELRVLNKKDQWLWIRTNITRVISESGTQCNKIVGTSRDITESILAEQEKINLKARLLQAQKLKSLGQLAGGMAHDFNNILSGIMSASQLLKSPKREMDERSLKYVDLIVDASRRGADLTSQLLIFSRKGDISFSTVNLHSIVDETISILKRTINKKINITAEKGAEHFIIKGNYSAIQNAFFNLGINAGHAMIDGGEFFIETKNVHSEHSYGDMGSSDMIRENYCEVTFRDTGTGISPEDLPNIFEPFFTTKKRGEGTGLGLATVYGTVQDHHGNIEVESVVGSGTSFKLIFPCSELKEKKNREMDRIIYGSGSILLVDDEEINRRVGKDLLESLGYSVIIAEGGLTALELYAEHCDQIDLVFLDMIMPDMNGSDVFLGLREKNKQCKVLVTSGYTSGEDVNNMLKNGLSGFIKKPYKISELSLLISDILKR